MYVCVCVCVRELFQKFEESLVTAMAYHNNEFNPLCVYMARNSGGSGGGYPSAMSTNWFYLIN